MARVNPYVTADVYRGNYGADQLREIRRSLAKTANQRMVRLERGKSKVTGESWDTFGAIIDARNYLEKQRPGKHRFTESKNVDLDTVELRREIAVLQGFLGRKTSTVKGMKEIEAKRLNAFETGKWGNRWKISGQLNTPLKFTSNKEFYDFLNSETFKGLVSSGFTSEQLVELYDSARARLPAEQEDDAVAQAMADALEAYRAKGNASLKDLTARMSKVRQTVKKKSRKRK